MRKIMIMGCSKYENWENKDYSDIVATRILVQRLNNKVTESVATNGMYE